MLLLLPSESLKRRRFVGFFFFFNSELKSEKSEKNKRKKKKKENIKGNDDIVPLPLRSKENQSLHRIYKFISTPQFAQNFAIREFISTKNMHTMESFDCLLSVF